MQCRPIAVAAPSKEVTVAPSRTPPKSKPGKPRVVILGSGWGAVSYLKALSKSDAAKYDITVISPRNYFLYTPLLPAVATGTMEERSIVEPVRQIVLDKAKYYEAAAQDIDTEAQELVCCFPKDAGFAEACFKVPYDHLILSVGSTNNTFGVKGVEEHCSYFKSIDDANALRARVSECFERASLPGCSADERRKLLSFVIVGGGPTGVEVAAELHDMITSDLKRLYPDIVGDAVIQVVELMDYVLSALDRKIGEYTASVFERTGIELILNSRVTGVSDGAVTIVDKDGAAREVPFGACVWATGIAMNPLVARIQEQTPQQTHFRSVITDDRLRVLGAPGMFAIGDAATVDLNKGSVYAESLFEEADTSGDGKLQVEELREILIKASYRFPHLEEYARFFDERYNRAGSTPGRFGGGLTDLLRGMAQKRDAGSGGTAGVPFEGITDLSELTLAEFTELLEKLDSGLRGLPATAQVARQQGEYLASMFAAHDPKKETVLGSEASAFEYGHKGSLAYIGSDEAVADLPVVGSLWGGPVGYLWKGFETVSQFSFKNRCLVALDWVRVRVFGRDISRV